MSKVGVCVAVLLGAVGIANAQPSQPPDVPATNDGAPPAPPPPTPPPPPVVAPSPVVPLSAYEQCRERRRQIGAEADATSNLKERTRLLQSMPECKPDMDQPPAPVSSEAVAGEEAPEGTGFALEVHLETGSILIDSNSVLPTTQAGLFLGHRSRSITLGVALDFGRIAQTANDSMGASTSSSSNTLLVMPGLRGVLARSRDEKTELLGQLDVGYGRNWASAETGMDSGPSIGHLRVQAAPGLRYWIAPSFAVGASAGLRYDRLSRSQDVGTGSSTMTLSTSALFSSVQLTGVF